MNAQAIYDLREKYESVSGTDLHDFFNKYLGEPSPSGYTELHQVVVDAAFVLFADGEIAIAWNNGGEFQKAKSTILEIGEELGISNKHQARKVNEAWEMMLRYDEI